MTLGDPSVNDPYSPAETEVVLRELRGEPVDFPEKKVLVLRGRASIAGRDYNPDDTVPVEVDAMLFEGVPARTMETYAHQWGRFLYWCGQTGREHLPPTVNTMRYYIWSHWAAVDPKTGKLRGRRGRPYSPNTVRTAVYSVSAVLQWKGHASPTRHPFIDRQIKGYAARWAAAGHRPDEADPLLPEESVAMARACDLRTVQGLRLATMCRLQFDLGARASEILGLNLGDVSWVRAGDAPQIRVWVARSKTDQDARGRALIVEAVPEVDGDVDPALLLGRWVDACTAAGNTDPHLPLFPIVEAGPARKDGRLAGRIGTDRMAPRAYELAHDRAVVRARLNLDPHTSQPTRRVTTHSERAGMITAARDDGMLAEQVAARTGHSKASNTIHKYWRGGTQTGADNAGTRIRLARKRAADGQEG